MRWLKLFFTHKPLATQNNRIGGHSYQNLIRRSGRSPKSLANTGFFGFIKSFPLESQNVFFSDFIRFMCDFCPDNPAHTAIFDSPRDFCSQCVASCFLCSFSSSQPYYSICTTIPNYKALLNKLRGWRMERQPLFKSVISSRPFPALRWAYSSRFAALLAVCQT